jgi:hypothetical protein
MRKQDVKAGVVYAYREGKGDWAAPRPVVFLAAPKDGEQYLPSPVRGEKGQTYFTKPPSSGGMRYRAGYPIVRVMPERLAEANADTLADFEKASSPRARAGRFDTISNLAYIIGPYAEELAAYEGRASAARERRARELEAEQASRARAIDVITALSAHDIRPRRIAAYGPVEALWLPLGEAEKLVAMLSGRTVPDNDTEED